MAVIKEGKDRKIVNEQLEADLTALNYIIISHNSDSLFYSAWNGKPFLFNAN